MGWQPASHWPVQGYQGCPSRCSMLTHSLTLHWVDSGRLLQAAALRADQHRKKGRLHALSNMANGKTDSARRLDSALGARVQTLAGRASAGRAQQLGPQKQDVSQYHRRAGQNGGVLPGLNQKCWSGQAAARPDKRIQTRTGNRGDADKRRQVRQGCVWVRRSSEYQRGCGKHIR